jgi:DNA-binding beta-propeller fold protein YncE
MKQRGSTRSLAGSRGWLARTAARFDDGCRAALLSALLVACNLENPGVAPPPGVLAYPVALGLSTEQSADGPKYLYVVNSNFDIRYNQGSVHSYRLDDIAKAVREPPEKWGAKWGRKGKTPCLQLGLPAVTPADDMPVDGGVELPEGYEAATEYGTPRGILCDGRDPLGHDECCIDNSEDFLESEVLIDSYATSLGMRSRSDGSDRLYVPLRGKNDVLYIDVNAGMLSCGGPRRCRRQADDENPAAPDESFATQPTAVAVGTLAQLGVTDEARGKLTFVSTVHDRGSVSLFVEPTPDAAPLLQDVWVPSGNPRATSVSLGGADRPVLYVTASNTSSINQLSVRGAQGASGRDLLVGSEVGNINVTGFATQDDLRDVAVDPDDSTLLYALVRGSGGSALESVVFLRLDSSTNNNARVIGATRVGAGPSKLTLATFGGRRVLLVSTYNARAIFIIDAASRQLVQVVRGLAGPFEMVVDEAREFIYVADFGASVLRVLDARGIADRSQPPPRIVVTLGERYYGGGL